MRLHQLLGSDFDPVECVIEAVEIGLPDLGKMDLAVSTLE